MTNSNLNHAERKVNAVNNAFKKHGGKTLVYLQRLGIAKKEAEAKYAKLLKNSLRRPGFFRRGPIPTKNNVNLAKNRFLRIRNEYSSAMSNWKRENNRLAKRVHVAYNKLAKVNNSPLPHFAYAVY
jgi:hypothetical protein